MSKRLFWLSLFFSSFLLLLINFTVRTAAALDLRERPLRERYVPDEILVKFKEDKIFPRKVRLPQGLTVNETIARYQKDPRVEYAEPNYIATALLVPNDTYYSYQWHLSSPSNGGVNLEPAWDITDGSGVVIAVIDTGIAYEDNGWFYQKAPDLSGTCFVPGYDFVSNDSHPNDDHGHGTHVAGTLAQTTNNNAGTAGVAFGSCLMPVKVLNSSGSGTYSQVIDGIHWAVDHGAKVINLSLGGPDYSIALEQAVAYAYQQGVVVVAASGNASSSQAYYPAGYDDYVIAVGATQYDKTKAPYSNYGPSLDLVAPGGNLSLDQNNDGNPDGILQQTFRITGWRVSWGYYFQSGTSSASPHVAGTVALLMANGLTGPDQVRSVLETSAEDLGPIGWDENHGWGLVNAASALGIEPVATPTNTPIPTSTPIATLTPTNTPTNTPTPLPSEPTSTPTLTSTSTPTPIPTATPTSITTATPTPTPGTGPEIFIDSVVAKDTSVRGDYQVETVLVNPASSAVSVTAHLEIRDPSNSLVSWSGLKDKEVNLSAGEIKIISWSSKVRWRSSTGVYKAEVSIFSQDQLLDIGSDTFLVSYWTRRPR